MLFRNSRRLTNLEEDLQRLQRKFDALELEWNDVYDKLRRSMGRIVKSRAIIEAKEQPPEDGREAPAAGSSPELVRSGGRLLTPRQLQIQQDILKRRAGGG